LADGPFLLPGAPFTPDASGDDDGAMPFSPLVPAEAPLLDEFESAAGPFLLPGAPLTPAELSEGVRASLPVFTCGLVLGEESAASAGAAAKSGAQAAIAKIFLMVWFPSFVVLASHPGLNAAPDLHVPIVNMRRAADL
jgi:hypothetical protein